MTTSDYPPLTALELAELKRLRIGKPRSYALPKNAYQNSEKFVHYERERAEKDAKKSKKISRGK